MSEEKKNLTEEERKELKEKMKKQIDEMSDEELDNVAGGGFLFPDADDTYICPNCRKKFSDRDEMKKHFLSCSKPTPETTEPTIVRNIFS